MLDALKTVVVGLILIGLYEVADAKEDVDIGNAPQVGVAKSQPLVPLDREDDEDDGDEERPRVEYRAGAVNAHMASRRPKPSGITRQGALREECSGSGPYYDLWYTPNLWDDPYADGSFHSFSQHPIPQGFFGPGSDAFSGSVQLMGGPLCQTEFGEFERIDVIIERSDDPFDPCTAPTTTAAVEIQIVALNFVSVEPITVTYYGGGSPEQWDVTVGLSEVAAPPGLLTAIKTHCGGGTFTSELYVQPTFTFTKGDPPTEVRFLDTGLPGYGPIAPSLLEQTVPVPWAHEVEDPEDPCTKFHALVDVSVEEKVCKDCNENGISDTCDIEDETSNDFNMNGIPDECEIGACCDPADATCTHAAFDTCTTSGGNYRGEGTFCGVCPDFWTLCTSDADCDPPDPGSCWLFDTCDVSACCELSGGSCNQVTTTTECDDPDGAGPLVGTEQFLGYGTDCELNCCEQPSTTGYQTCQEADDPGNLVEITVPVLGNPPVTVTLSGDTSTATTNGCGALDTDKVIWHAFSINECAQVTIDLCCTDPVHDPTFDTLFDSCPCGSPISAAGAERGGLYSCFEGNLIASFDPLPAGTYYYPVHAGTGQASMGPYQLHITVEGCPVAACCMGDDCEMLTEIACDQAGGYWLWGVVWCGAQPDCDLPGANGVCCTGACCTGPGVCYHDTPTYEDMDEEICDIINGTFYGGAVCGTCFGGSSDGQACYEDWECPDGDCRSTMPCPPVGACCVGTACTDTDEPRCAGEFYMDIPCSMQPCDQPGPCIDCILPDVEGYPHVQRDAEQCAEIGGIECNEVGDPPQEDPLTPDVGCGTKNRYMSFQAGEPDQQIAIRVTFAEMPPPFVYAEGRIMWVQEPFQVSENSGYPGPDPPPRFWAATLGCDPFYTDWSVYGTVDAYDAAIVPEAEFDVQWIEEGYPTDEECLYSVPLTVVMSEAGDVVGNCTVTPCTPPDCDVDFVDIPALVDKFRNLPGAPRKARSDLIGANCLDPLPDRMVSFVDITYAVDAFRGLECTLPGPPVTDPCAP